MTESTERDCFQRLVQRLEPQSKLVRSWELKGGVSAQVTALEIEQLDGKRRKVVVRRHGAADIAQNPHVAADEFKLMELLKSVGVAAPVPFFLDQSGEIFSTPYVVIEYIEGKTEFTPADVTDHVFQLVRSFPGFTVWTSRSWICPFCPNWRRHVPRKSKNGRQSQMNRWVRDAFGMCWRQSGHCLRGIHPYCCMEIFGQEM